MPLVHLDLQAQLLLLLLLLAEGYQLCCTQRNWTGSVSKKEFTTPIKQVIYWMFKYDS